MINKPAVNWMILAFAVRLLTCLGLHIYSLEAGFEGFYPLSSGSDDGLYWDLAAEVMDGNTPEFMPNSYPFILATLFSLTGQNLLIGKLLSVIAGSVTVYFGVVLACELCEDMDMSPDDRQYSANLTGLFITFYPSALFYSTQLVRDLLLVLFGILNLYFSVKILKKRRQNLWIFWSLTLLAVYSLREYAAVSLVMSLFAYVMFIWKTKITKKMLLMTLFIIVCAIVPYFLNKGIFGLERILPMLNADEIIRQREEGYSTGGSSTGIYIDYSNPIIFIFTYGQSFITAMFGPLPWQLTSIVQIIALPEAVFMWILCFKLRQVTSKKLTNKYQPKEEIILLIFTFILTGIFALFSDNIGANTRLRMLPWISFIIYASIMFKKPITTKII